MDGCTEFVDAPKPNGHADAGEAEGADKPWPEPMPLIRPLGQTEPFPIDALGTILGNAAKGITDLVQCPLAIAACSVLAVASLATQPHVDVVHPATGHPLPVSLFLLSSAESGERKSAADKEALGPVRQHEKFAIEEYKLAFARWRNQAEAWEATRATIKKKAKGNWRELEEALLALGDEPKAPAKPYVTVSEPTFEGLAKLLAEGQPSMGLFSAEGGGFLGGHAMRDESRLRALTGLSELWDGSPLKRTRAGDGALQLVGRRLSLHLMVQPSVAPLLLADDMANGQGFLSRLLVCAPRTTQGYRFQRDPQPWARPAIDAYSEVILDLLRRKPRTIGDNELDPVPLSLTDAATVTWRSFADDMERGLAAEGLSSGIRGLRNKVPEMALRIAGVLAGVEGAGELTVDTLERGMLIATFFLSEAKRLYEAAMTRPEIGRAEKLLRWLVAKNINQISLRDILVTGPSAFRDSDAVKATVAILVGHNLCRIEMLQTGGRPSERLFLSPYAASILQ